MQRHTSDDLKRKLERIEALYRRPGSEGEKQAAAAALNRLRSRLQVVDLYQKRVEVRDYVFTVFKQA